MLLAHGSPRARSLNLASFPPPHWSPVLDGKSLIQAPLHSVGSAGRLGPRGAGGQLRRVHVSICELRLEHVMYVPIYFHSARCAIQRRVSSQTHSLVVQPVGMQNMLGLLCKDKDVQQQSLIRRATTRQLHRAQEMRLLRSDRHCSRSSLVAPSLFQIVPLCSTDAAPQDAKPFVPAAVWSPQNPHMHRCQYLLAKEVLAVVIGVCSVVPYNMAGARVFRLGAPGCVQTRGLARRSWLTPLHLLLLVPWPSQKHTSLYICMGGGCRAVLGVPQAFGDHWWQSASGKVSDHGTK